MKLKCLISTAACKAGNGAGGGSGGFSLKPGCYKARNSQVEGGKLPPQPSWPPLKRQSQAWLSSCFFPESRKEMGKLETQIDELKILGLWIQTFS